MLHEYGVDKECEQREGFTVQKSHYLMLMTQHFDYHPSASEGDN